MGSAREDAHPSTLASLESLGALVGWGEEGRGAGGVTAPRWEGSLHAAAFPNAAASVQGGVQGMLTHRSASSRELLVALWMNNQILGCPGGSVH